MKITNKASYANLMKKTKVLAAITLIVAAMIIPAAMAAEITTAKLYYFYPEEQTVDIMGSGFLGNTAVNITINLVEADSLFSDVITSSSDGSFIYTYHLDGTATTYVVTATDGENTATTTFYDARNPSSIATTKASYLTSETVRAIINSTGSGSTPYNVYVYKDTLPNDGDTLSDYRGSYTTVTLTSNSQTFDIWSPTTDPGTYYLVLDSKNDQNHNGTYQSGNGGDLVSASFTISAPSFNSLTISGVKYDTEGNGLEGWTIELYNSTDDSLYDSTTTGVDGSYLFTVTDPGTYYINEVLQAGWTATSPTYQIGDALTTMEVTGYSDITVVSGTDVTDQDFVNFQWVTVSGTKTDYSSGSGLSGWTMKLYNTTDDSLYASTTTAVSTGAYSFTVKDPGTYYITEVLPTGWTATSPTYQVGPNSGSTEVTGYSDITVVSGTDVTDQDFVNFQWMAVSGYKYDTDHNGLEGWTIELYNSTDDTVYASTTTLADGSYSFTVKDPGSYYIDEVLQAGWTKVSPTSPYTFTAESGTNLTGKNFVNIQLPPSIVTTPSGCPFDIDKNPDNGQQFRLIFTNDPTKTGSYKLTASNPGQFAYNIFYIGTLGENIKLDISIPFPFVTQGAQPIQLFSSVSKVSCCYVFSGPISANSITSNGTKNTKTPSGALGINITDYTTQTFGEVVTVHIEVTVPASGLVCVTIHLDYGLKGTPGYTQSGNNAVDSLNINDTQTYEFSVSGDQNDVETIQSENVFKHDPGVAGIVLDSSGNPVSGASVQIKLDGKTVTVTTDEDGYFMYYYKYTGKATTATVTLLGYNLVQKPTVKSNSLVFVTFTVP
jgi:hypothetical protein